MMDKKMIALLAVALLATTSCAALSGPQRGVTASTSDDRFGTRYMAAQIHGTMRTADTTIEMPLIITTFVDLNDLTKTSVFGRMMAEKMINDLNRIGFHIVEIRRAQDIFVRKDVGELILTREAAELADASSVRAVLAGTYVATTKSVIINARLIDVRSPQVLSTVSYEVTMTEEIENLIKGTSPF